MIEISDKMKTTNMNVFEVKLVKNAEVPYSPRRINVSKDIVEFLHKYYKDKDREILLVLMLDTGHNIIGMNVVSIGTLDSACVHPREVFKPAIVANSSCIILVHNHPSTCNQVTPSKQDDSTTHNIKKAGEILGINLLDHIIIGDGVYYSYVENLRMMN
jgi:DNA repair protein RadC